MVRRVGEINEKKKDSLSDLKSEQVSVTERRSVILIRMVIV